MEWRQRHPAVLVLPQVRPTRVIRTRLRMAGLSPTDPRIRRDPSFRLRHRPNPLGSVPPRTGSRPSFLRLA